MTNEEKLTKILQLLQTSSRDNLLIALQLLHSQGLKVDFTSEGFIHRGYLNHMHKVFYLELLRTHYQTDQMSRTLFRKLFTVADELMVFLRVFATEESTFIIRENLDAIKFTIKIYFSHQYTVEWFARLKQMNSFDKLDQKEFWQYTINEYQRHPYSPRFNTYDYKHWITIVRQTNIPIRYHATYLSPQVHEFVISVTLPLINNNQYNELQALVFS